MNLGQLLFASETDLPFVPAPRVYRGCMGRIVPGITNTPGHESGQPDAVFSWLLQLFSNNEQTQILNWFKSQGDEDFLLSWPDFRNNGGSAQQFGDQCLQVRRAGLRPCVMLWSKYYDPGIPNGPIPDTAPVFGNIDPVIPEIKRAGVPRVGIGWELNSNLSPEGIQAMIDRYAPQVRAWGGLVYTHFLPGTDAWQLNGQLFADFWKTNVNKLRGTFHQKINGQSNQDFAYAEGGLNNVLLHFNGGSLCPADSGDGTPFDLVAFENDLQLWSNGQITEDQMHAIGAFALTIPAVNGPTGPVRVMGSGCGQ